MLTTIQGELAIALKKLRRSHASIVAEVNRLEIYVASLAPPPRVIEANTVGSSPVSKGQKLQGRRGLKNLLRIPGMLDVAVPQASPDYKLARRDRSFEARLMCILGSRPFVKVHSGPRNSILHPCFLALRVVAFMLSMFVECLADRRQSFIITMS